MLSLDSTEWSLLRHAYGPASDTPAFLRSLAADPRPQVEGAEPWDRLWSSLCHQETAYSASYAAVPHIVEIARISQGPIDFSFFQLPTCVEISRCSGRGPAVPDNLAVAYHRAISRLSDCVFRHLADAWDQDMAQAVAAALVVAKGQIRLGEALINLDRDTIAKIVNDEL